mgnify:CR=1 FL=1
MGKNNLKWAKKRKFHGNQFTRDVSEREEMSKCDRPTCDTKCKPNLSRLSSSYKKIITEKHDYPIATNLDTVGYRLISLAVLNSVLQSYCLYIECNSGNLYIEKNWIQKRVGLQNCV